MLEFKLKNVMLCGLLVLVACEAKSENSGTISEENKVAQPTQVAADLNNSQAVRCY